MKKIIQSLAVYNAKVDAKLVEILRGQSELTLREDQGAFYKSILGTFEHIFSADVIWLKRFAGFFSYPSLAASGLVSADIAETKARAAKSPAELFALVDQVDALFVAFAGELEEKQLLSRVKFKNIKGEELEREYWALVVHVLNHATHHRGEISALLDRKGVANDYSGFNLYLG
ncbi:MAG: DinB family protein [Spirochaetaceae bacterium]|nr:DinB family protein [Spirochaetaceae bacterium]